MSIIIVNPPGGGGGGTGAWADITGKPATFPPDTHSHDSSGIDDAAVTIAKLSSEFTTVGKDVAQAATPEDVRTIIELNDVISGANEGDHLVWDATGTEWVMERLTLSVTFGQATPTAGTYVISHYPNFTGIITGMRAATSAGTLNLTVTVDGVNVTGLATIAVNSTPTTTTSTATDFNEDSVLRYVIAAPSGAANLVVSLLITRKRNT